MHTLNQDSPPNDQPGLFSPANTLPLCSCHCPVPVLGIPNNLNDILIKQFMNLSK